MIRRAVNVISDGDDEGNPLKLCLANISCDVQPDGVLLHGLGTHTLTQHTFRVDAAISLTALVIHFITFSTLRTWIRISHDPNTKPTGRGRRVWM